jgi:hypothetical protein
MKDFGALITASQREGKPLFDVRTGSAAQRKAARTALTTIAEAIEASATKRVR